MKERNEMKMIEMIHDFPFIKLLKRFIGLLCKLCGKEDKYERNMKNLIHTYCWFVVESNNIK